MKISAESVNEARQNEERRVDEQKTSDRFSQLLKGKDDRSQGQQTASKADGADGQLKSPSIIAGAESGNLSGVDASVARTSVVPDPADAGKIAQPGSAAAAQIDKLTTEIGHQIDIFRQEGGAQAVNITFDSRTLEGLQVQIRQQDGELTIRFITQSDNVSKLLGRHTGELREALAGKGVRIGNIAITSTRHSPVLRRSEYAGA
jgi:flagellar hook-length control protein FliK